MERKPLSELLAVFLIYAIRHRGDAYDLCATDQVGSKEGMDAEGYLRG